MSRFPHMPDATDASPTSPAQIIHPPATVISGPEPDCTHPAEWREGSFFQDATNFWRRTVCGLCGGTVEIADGGPAMRTNGREHLT